MRSLIELDHELIKEHCTTSEFATAFYRFVCGQDGYREELARYGFRVIGTRTTAEPVSIVYGDAAEVENSPPCRHEIWDYDVHGNFCPRCGASMVKGSVVA
jgi:ribosomal protein S27AE